ncbi:MAG: hypothetical protein WC718_10890 [Phycisphaerales bacterium]|jgi:hypothetical protein
MPRQGKNITLRELARGVGWWLAPKFVVVGGAAAVCFWVLSMLPASVRPADWFANKGVPEPPDFRVALFPVDNEVRLCASPGGASVGGLRRALVVESRDVREDGWVAVHRADGTVWVKRASLTYEPSKRKEMEETGYYKFEYEGMQPTLPGYARVSVREDPPGTPLVILQASVGDYSEQYVYDISEGKARPLSREHLVEGHAIDGMHNQLRVIAALAAAFVYMVVAVVALWVLRWWIRTRQIRSRKAVH